MLMLHCDFIDYRVIGTFMFKFFIAAIYWLSLVYAYGSNIHMAMSNVS